MYACIGECELLIFIYQKLLQHQIKQQTTDLKLHFGKMYLNFNYKVKNPNALTKEALTLDGCTDFDKNITSNCCQKTYFQRKNPRPNRFSRPRTHTHSGQTYNNPHFASGVNNYEEVTPFKL